MIDPTFRNIKRLYTQSFKDGDHDPARDSFDEHYIRLVQIKDFNALLAIDHFFDQFIENKQEPYEKLVGKSRKHDCTTGNVLNYSYH